MGAGPPPSARRSVSASLRAMMIVRCWPRLAWAATGTPPRVIPRSSRCGPGQRGAVPDLLLPDRLQPAPDGGRQALGVEASWITGGPHRDRATRPSGRRGRSAHPVPLLVLRRDRVVQRTDPRGEVIHQRQAGGHDPAADDRQLLVPDGQPGRIGLLGSNRPQQGVALGEDPAEVGQVAGRGARALAEDGVQEAAPLGGAPTRRSISSGRNRTARSVSATEACRRATPFTVSRRRSPRARRRRAAPARSGSGRRPPARASGLHDLQPDPGQRRAMGDEGRRRPPSGATGRTPRPRSTPGGSSCRPRWARR